MMDYIAYLIVAFHTPTPQRAVETTMVVAPRSIYIIDEINRIRKENGLGELKEDERLNESAYMKAHDMTARGYWSHEDPEGNLSWGMVRDAGYDYSYIGENMANKFNDKRAVIEWMNSETHRNVILNPIYEDIGVGHNGNYIVVHFGKE